MTATRAFVAPTRSRPWPVPPDGALHLIGDTHFGSAPMTAARKRLWADDLATGMLPTGLTHVIVGDVTDTGATTAGQDSEAVAFCNTWLGSGNWWAAVGNHDILGSNRTPDAAALAWGMPASNFVRDLPYARLIVVSPDSLQGNQTSMTDFTPERLSWISAQAAATSLPSLVVCHWSIYNTVGASEASATQYRSIDTGYYATADAAVRAMLADTPGIKAWISGHTHSPLEAAGLITSVTAGGHSVAAINCSAVAWTGKPADNTTSPVRTLYATVTDGQIDVRFRDHGSGAWCGAGPDGRRVWSTVV